LLGERGAPWAQTYEGLAAYWSPLRDDWAN
jgi:hypothetical protein